MARTQLCSEWVPGTLASAVVSISQCRAPGAGGTVWGPEVRTSESDPCKHPVRAPPRGGAELQLPVASTVRSVRSFVTYFRPRCRPDPADMARWLHRKMPSWHSRIHGRAVSECAIFRVLPPTLDGSNLSLAPSCGVHYDCRELESPTWAW
jgi:hypothetical protein